MIQPILKKEGLFRSIFTAFIILFLHLLLLAGAGVTIILFKGLYNYLPWVMGTTGLLVIGLACLFYQRIKNSTSDIRQILSMPEFRDRTVEIRLIGGLASLKIEAATGSNAMIEQAPIPGKLAIDLDENNIETRILRLNNMYERQIISRDDFEKAKQEILQG